MKKKMVMALLAMAMSVNILAGCGNKVEGDKVQAVMADAGNAGSPESGAEGKEAEESVAESTAESTEESEPESAEEPETAAEPEAETTEEPEAEAAAEPDATAEPTAESEAGAAASPETEGAAEPEGEEGSMAEAGADASEDAAGADADKSASSEEKSFTYEELDSVMYAKSSANVRDLPNTSGKKVTSLKAGQEVAVIGRCVETGWYCIKLDGETTAYVSDTLLVAEKPAPQQQQATEAAQTQDQAAQGTTPREGTAASADDSAAIAAAQAQQTQTSSYLSQDFVNYLNQKRSEQGLPQISWNSGLESLALRRAEEISSNFAHPTMMEATEIILATDGSDSSSWYQSWYDSQGHRLVLQDDHMTDGACGIYQVGNYYYVAFVCTIAPPTAEEMQEKMDNGEMTLIDTTEAGHQIWTDSPDNVSNATEEEQAEIDALLKSLGLL